MARRLCRCRSSQSANDSPAPLVATPGQAGQAVGHPQLVAGAQELGRQKAAGQVERGRPETGPESRDLPLGIEKDQLRLAAEHRVDPDPPAEVGEVRAAGHAHVLAVVDQLAGRRVVERAGAAAQPRPALQERDPQPAIDQRRRGRQARQAAADDHDMRRGRLWERLRHQRCHDRVAWRSEVQFVGYEAGYHARRTCPANRPQCNRSLPPGRNGDPAVEDVVIPPRDLVEQGAVNADDGQEHGPAHRVDERRERVGRGRSTR